MGKLRERVNMTFLKKLRRTICYWNTRDDFLTIYYRLTKRPHGTSWKQILMSFMRKDDLNDGRCNQWFTILWDILLGQYFTVSPFWKVKQFVWFKFWNICIFNLIGFKHFYMFSNLECMIYSKKHKNLTQVKILKAIRVQNSRLTR